MKRLVITISVVAFGAALPAVTAPIPCREYLDVASHYTEWTDSGGDVGYQLRVAKWGLARSA